MSSHVPRNNADIAAAVLSAMDAWEFVSGPEGFGWAPDRHLRAVLKRGERRISVVIRRSWSEEGFSIETFLYSSVLPQIDVRAPKLWSVFSPASDGSKWMILEDLGERHPGSSTDQTALFAALGQLHGGGLRLAGELSDTVVPRFKAEQMLAEWKSLLAPAVTEPHYELPGYTPAALEDLYLRLSEQPPTLLHGDTDLSNVIMVGDEAALIDWERAKVGPPSLDLGKALEAAGSPQALEAYRSAFNSASGLELTTERIGEWADLAALHNCLHWICYYVRSTQQGQGPGDDWRRDYYEPCLRKMDEVVKRQARSSS